MRRRDFLKISGATVAGSVLSACTGEPERLIPFLIPPDDGVVPGEATYYAGVCGQCAAGCGTVVRVAEGRVKKLEGNPLHPVNRGKLCARGQAAVQALYHPDRILRPLSRTGERGSGSFAPISWDEALAKVAGQLTALRSQDPGERFLMITPRLGPGTRKNLVTAFIDAVGSTLHLEFDLFDTASHARAAEDVYGVRAIPDYDIARTGFLLSFGADFLESGISPVRYGRAFGEMRQGRTTVRGTFTYAGPRLSVTAASADRWLPVRPGREATLALALARIVLEEGLFHGPTLEAAGQHPEVLLRELAPYTPERAAEETGIPASDIRVTARGFGTIKPSVAIAGDAVAAQTGGQKALAAIHLLNLLVGNLGREGGVLVAGGSSTTRGEGRGNPPDSGALSPALAALRSDRIGMALISGVDPVYEIPASTEFRALLGKVPFIVSFASFMDETALRADLILPDRTDLESWDDVFAPVAMADTVVGLMQPAVQPLGETRQFGDSLLGIARAAGGGIAEALPSPSYRDMVRDSVRALTGSPAGADFERIWEESLRHGGVFREQGTDRGPTVPPPAIRIPVLREPIFEGAPDEFPLHLIVYRSVALAEGRVAHSPWLQELPDPLTTAVWDNWVEINHSTAAARGIEQGDLVEIESPAGSVRLPAVLQPGIRPDTIAIPLGRGHADRGRYAAGRGVNPLDVLVYREDATEQVPAWGATRVRLTKISSRGGLVVAGHADGAYRGELLGI